MYLVTGGLTDVRALSVSELSPAKTTVFSDLIQAMEDNPPHKLTVSKYTAKQISSSTGTLASDPNKMFNRLDQATIAKINIQVWCYTNILYIPRFYFVTSLYFTSS